MLTQSQHRVTDAHWRPFAGGSTIGKEGPEDGTIILDLEHVEGARVIIEKNAWLAPFIITVNISGFDFHSTRYEIKEEETLCFANRITQKINVLYDHLHIPDEKRDDTWQERYHNLLV